MTTPYDKLPDRQFWKLSVPDNPELLEQLYKKRFSIYGKRIATAGSCFAQEIARELRKQDYEVIDMEPGPGTLEIRGDRLENRYGYGLYSARHGNIYTVRQLLQLTQEAFGLLTPDPDCYVWTNKSNRYFDSLRPSIEPDGLESFDEVIAQRQDHLCRFRKVIEKAEIFIFTLGLTEAWMHKKSGLIYPTAPGVLAGDYDPEIHILQNFSAPEIYNDFSIFRKLVLQHNRHLKFILTVSPVPLTATATDEHVLVATIRSKSVLRAVTSQLYERFKDIDYFPSYEIFSTPFLGVSLFNENKRNVSRKGVGIAMKIFLREHSIMHEISENHDVSQLDPVCEEALLDAFTNNKDNQ
jgi:hypothetical protein